MLLIEKKPLHKNNVIQKDLGDEFLIYSPEHKEMHVFNPTARLIWNLCDGKHTIVDMEKEMRSQFSIPPDRDVKVDIQNAVEIFHNKGLLENDGESK